MHQAGGTILGLDTDVEIKDIWPTINFAPIQGNLAPEFLLEDFSVIKKEAQNILDQVNGRPGFIFNLGHGILPATPVDNVIKLIDFVHTATLSNRRG